MLEIAGVSGSTNLHVHVVARDAVTSIGSLASAGHLGVERTETGLVMRQLLDYRVSPLL